MASLLRKVISTLKAPAPVGGAPYKFSFGSAFHMEEDDSIFLQDAEEYGFNSFDQAIAFNDVVYLSGVLGMDVKSNKLVEGGAAAEAQQSLKNIGHILEAAGSSYANVIKSTIMLRSIEDFGTVNEVYKQFFKKDFPARSTYQVGKLPLNAAVEIEVIAAIGDVKTITSKY